MPEHLEGEFILDNNGNHSAPAAAATPSTPAPAALTHSASLFSNLVENPDNVTFETQDADEEIILLVRRDLITNVPWILSAIVLIFIPILVSAFSSLFTPFFNFSIQTQLIGVLFYYLIVFGFILIEFTLWYFNIGLVTNKRIVDFDVSGILSKHVSETRLNLIEDVSYIQVGSIRTIFNYGDVVMQTAGSLPNFEFDRAPEPARIVRIIGDMIGGPR